MAAIMHSSHKLKMGYRRTESDPACTTVNDIRCKFEATGDAVKSPELGLAFGVKQRTSNPSSTASSPLVQRKIGIPEYANASQIKTLASQNKIGKQGNDWKLDKLNSANLSLSQPVQLKQADTKVTADKQTSSALTANSVVVKPNTLQLSNGNHTQNSKHTLDKSSVISQHNASIVSTLKQTLYSPICNSNSSSQAAVQSNTVKPAKNISEKLESLANKFQTPPAIIPLNAVSEQKQQKTPIQTNSRRDHNHNRNPSISSLSSISSSECGKSPLTPARAYFKTMSIDSDRTESKHNSLIEPGTDYTKIRKSLPPAPTSKARLRESSGNSDTLLDSKLSPLTAANLKRVSDSLVDTKSLKPRSYSVETDSYSQNSRPLSKSPSVSSTCSSMESELEYYNSGARLRRRETKPPTNIVARRTQLFEKSMDEINAVLEEAEAYNKMKDGVGLVFKPKDAATKDVSKQKPNIIKSVPQISPISDRKSQPTINNNTKQTNNNLSSTGMPLKSALKNSSGDKPLKNKPLPALPVKQPTVGKEREEFRPKPGPPLSLKPNTLYRGTGGLINPPPPPKPPRTFGHADAEGFDPAAIPRQEGDGEENHDYEQHVSCQSNHIYTSVTASNERPYTSTLTTTDTRPYTSLTTTGSSGGDDSIAGSENMYDTLGRASVASSCEHYDTISQSELDSDVSRPPTLPRRPSNLHRHRPLSTGFSHLDIAKNNTAFHHQLNKALTTASTIKETSPTSPSPTKIKVPFKLKYLLPKARRKADEIRKAASVGDLLDDSAESLYDSVDIKPRLPEPNNRSSASATLPNDPQVPIDEAGYALPDIKVCCNHKFTEVFWLPKSHVELSSMWLLFNQLIEHQPHTAPLG